CSLIFAGLAMVIVSSTLIKNFMGWRCDDDFKNNLDRITLGLSTGCAYAMITYLVIKMVGVAHDQEWTYLLTGWGSYFMLELGIAVILPMFMFAIAIRNRLPTLARFAAFITVLGIIWNRINTALICFNWQLYQEIPHWREVWITVTIYSLYFLTYRFIVYRLPIVYEWKGER
ncbi:MAG: polysulfide reductase, partial [Bacteroidota bacterium]